MCGLRLAPFNKSWTWKRQSTCFRRTIVDDRYRGAALHHQLNQRMSAMGHSRRRALRCNCDFGLAVRNGFFRPFAAFCTSVCFSEHLGGNHHPALELGRMVS